MKKILTSLSLLLLAPHAFADTKLVAEITTGTDMTKRTVTVQFHGNQARRDASDGSIVLMDRDAKKVWVLNPTDKTYWSTSFGEYLSPTLSVVAAQRQPLVPHASFKLETVKEGAPDKAPSPAAIAPAESAQWSLKGLFWLQPSSLGGGGGMGRGGGGGGFPGGGGRRGGGGMGRGGGGGFPGGGGGFPGGSGGDSPRSGGGVPSRPLMQLSLAGQLWTASWDAQTDLPEKALHDLTILVTEELLPPQSPLRQAWQDELSRKKVLPLAATITSTSGSPTPPPSDGGASAPPSQPLTGVAPQGAAHFLVTSVEKGLTLEASLFKIPEGFTEVPAPKPAPLSLPR